MAGRKSKGSSPSIPRTYRINADLVSAMEAAVADGAAASLTAILEDGIRLRLNISDQADKKSAAAESR